MTRIPVIDPKHLTPEQQRVYDAATGLANRAGWLPPPYELALHCPELTDKWQQFGELLRYRTSLPRRLSEMAILITARHWSCHYEWYAHEPYGREGGIPDAVIEAIRLGKRPHFDQQDAEAVYDFVTEIQRTHFVSAAVHQRLVSAIRIQGLIELTGLLGHYTLIAMMLNANEYGVPAGVAPPLPPLTA
jgi:4-carboxymuconolactone decarboxylase